MTDRYQLSTVGDWFRYGVLIVLLSGCASEPNYVPSSDVPTPDFSGHWEIDYARSDSVQTQLNASFREVQRELRRRREAAERGATYQGASLGNLDRLGAYAQRAE